MISDGDRNMMTMASLKEWVLEAMRQNRFAEAEKTLRGALEAPAQGADLRFLLGTVLAASGKIDEAIQYLKKCASSRPTMSASSTISAMCCASKAAPRKPSRICVSR